MGQKETILNKIQILITIKQAEISGFLRGMVSSKLIEGYDKDGVARI